MMTALGTLPFLATLWLLVVLGARVLEESGAKITAALKGKPLHQPVAQGRTVQIRMRHQPRVMRAEPKLRAAA
jgi:hypothetical protein